MKFIRGTPKPMPAAVTNMLRFSAVRKSIGSPFTVLIRVFRIDLPKVFPNIERMIASTKI